MKKTKLLSALLMAIVMMAISPMKIWAQEQDLQFVAGSAGFTNEGTQWDPEIPENLVDGRTDTKWCYNFPGDGVTYIIVKASRAKELTSYRLVEGGDTYRETGRHWKAWTIYGGNFGSDEAATNDAAEWTVVHSVTDNLYENHASIFNAVGNEQAYQYYKIVVEDINSGTLHQMAEIYFTFKACEHSILTEYPATEATAEAHGNGAYKVCDLCGAYLDANGNEIAFPVLHYFDAEHTHACVEPTCTVAGSIAYKECVVCSAIFDMDNNPVSDTKIAATGHTFNPEGICTTCEYACEHTEYKLFDAEVHKCTVCQHAESHDINEETGICTVCHQSAAIAHTGTSGTCTWTIYENGDMIFAPTTGETGTLEEWWYWYDCPWYDYRDEIKSVKFQGEVIAKTCYGMFYLCTNLTAIDFSGFNTENVTEFDFMFGACLSIQSLNLSGFNTEKAETMSSMFVSCQALESLDLSSFNTANVQTIAYMFESCTHLATLKLSNDFVLNEGVEKTDLFADCGTWADQLSIYYVIDESIKEALNETETKIEELLMWGKVNFVPSAIVKDGVPFKMSQSANVPGKDVVVTRQFAAQKPASVMLPFTVNDASQISGATFYEFKGVKYENNEWVATMQDVSTIEAYKPYVVIREGAGDITFGTGSQTVSFPVTPGASSMTTTDPETGWTFQALNESKRWEEGDEEIGKAYGFVGKNKDYDDYSVAQGDFVKIAAGASAKPGRCYLIKDDGQPLVANAKGMTRAAAAEELPATIKVRFVNGDVITGIAELNTETGEMSAVQWYDLNGRKIDEPTKGGIYIKNNKKVFVK